MPPPDLPANEIRSRKRAPALPRLPHDGVDVLAGTHPTGARSPAPAELSQEPERGVLEAVARAVAHVGERRTAIPEAEIRAVALGHAPGRYTLAQVDAAIARLAAGGELIEAERRGMDRAFVTDRAVKAERQVLASMRAGRGKGMALAGADAVEARLGAVAAHRGPEGSGAGGAAVEGPRHRRAGPRRQRQDHHAARGEGAPRGHSCRRHSCHRHSCRRPRAADTRAAERTIQGLAPSAAAARVLAREAGIPSRTLQYFVTRFADLSDPERLARGRAEYAGAVLAVDEASMIDTVRADALLRIARELDVARVALVGDTAQLKAVDAGQPFRLLQKAGMATATMDEVLRQRDPELRATVGLTREGEPGVGDRCAGQPGARGASGGARHRGGPAAGSRWRRSTGRTPCSSPPRTRSAGRRTTPCARGSRRKAT